MVDVFVSGCYDVLHAGHVQFFREARALGDRLTVCFASAEVLWAHKKRRPSIPDGHKKALLEALTMVDRVVVGTGEEPGFDFLNHFDRLQPEVLATTEDDQYEIKKRALCKRAGCRYVQLPKTPPEVAPASTTSLLAGIRAPDQVPLRVDFAGGWLDVPRHAKAGAYIVNCAISPLVSHQDWSYEKRSGLGGSAAWAILEGRDGVTAELDLGVGWQDPAIITETGLCVWRSGPTPALDVKTDGAMLMGRLALLWTEREHDTPGVADRKRDYGAIERAGHIARTAVWAQDLQGLANAVNASYSVQQAEGMRELPRATGCLARKYCGGGFGGYAMYLFAQPKDRGAWLQQHSNARPIEPYLDSI